MFVSLDLTGGEAAAKEHYLQLGGNAMSIELLIQLLMLIVMIIDMANRSKDS
ncbi:hypothetical protein [Paenibacillus sp. LHD-38]|uniref:hypothetical protein n=1 Tax=Paenibacillus sp. LHD-38 TaxID=3072143 RepID=UPI00280EB78C|nr:hypothetical protein [Paenibacillus sp. LHD-38]MDQ8733651.1 hypothetical protein [Paenibacillus sp. LHD-38]